MGGIVSRREQIEVVLGNLVSAVAMLQGCPEFSALIPEVRVNLACALPHTVTPQDVAAVEGRITVVRGLPRACGLPALGASGHLARRIIEARKYDAAIGAAINFRCDETVIEIVREYCSRRGLLFGRVERAEEPAEIARQDGASMPWKVRQLVVKYGALPRLFYEGEGWGKEALFLALGRDAVEVAGIAVEIARGYRAKIQARRPN